MHTRTLLAVSIALALMATAGHAQASVLSDAYSAYHGNNYATAALDFQQAASQASGPPAAKAYYMEGLSYHHLGRDAQAVTAYQQAQLADPSLSFAPNGGYQHNLGIAQKDAARESGAPAPTSGTVTTNTTTTHGTPSTDPVANALAGDDVYIAPGVQGVDQTRLQQAARENEQTPVKIAILESVPRPYKSVTDYTHWLHDYLNLGKNGLIVVAEHGHGNGVDAVSSALNTNQERQLADKYVARLGNGDFNNTLPLMAADLATQANAAYYRPMHNLEIIALIVIAVVVLLIWSATRKKRVQINTMRGPLEQAKNNVIAGIEYMDNYIDVLPKNNADSDQVRAFRQAAAYKVDQAEKIMARSTEVSDMNRAQSLIDQAGADVQNGRRYLDRATGGTGEIKSDDAVKPIPFPVNQQQVSQVPDEQRGVSFFSSQPAPVSQLVPVTLNVDGQQRTVMATPQEADMVRRGQIPPVRSFNVGGQQVPWYAYQNYDPYNDYWTYQNNGWRGVAGGAIAGFLGAELLNSLFHPNPYWGGGWYSPYAYGPGWDSWGGWGGYGYGGGGFGMGGYDQGYIQGEEQARAQDYALHDQYTSPGQDPNYAGGGASFGGSGYDTSDYGNSGGGASFGGDRS